MKGRWFNIAEEVKEQIDATGYEQKWKLDPKGYFLIRINKESDSLEVGHCTTDNQLVRVITGPTPESIMYKMIDGDYLSLLDHAAYLGKELQKAFISLKYPFFKYTQDSPLEYDENIKN